MVGLAPLARPAAGEASYGEKRRVEIAIALAQQQAPAAGLAAAGLSREERATWLAAAREHPAPDSRS